MRLYTPIALVLFSVTSCLGSGITRSNEKSMMQDSLVQLASRYYNDGDFKHAIALMDPADTLSRSPKLLYYLGMSYSALYDYPLAIGCFQQAVGGDSANVVYRFQYARMLILSGALERAADELSTCTSLDSTYLPAWYQLGLLYNMQGNNIEKECEIFSYLVRQNQADFLSLYYLGNALLKTEQADSGVVYLNRSIAVNPRYFPSLAAMANYHDAKKLYPQALEFYKKALEMRPHDKGVLFKTAECLRKSGALNEAVACFKKAIAVDSVNDAIHAQLGYAYYSLGRFDSSVMAYKTAIALDDDNVNYYRNISLAYQKMDSVDAAVWMAKKGIDALHPGDLLLARTGLSAYLTFKHRAPDAVTMYKKNIGDAYMELGAYYQSNNRRQEAIAAYQHVKEYDPENFSLDYRIANLYEAMNDFKSAIQVYTKMAQSIGKDGERMFKPMIDELKKKMK